MNLSLFRKFHRLNVADDKKEHHSEPVNTGIVLIKSADLEESEKNT